MRVYEQQPKLLKIHKNVAGMLRQVKQIIKSSSILPVIHQPSRQEFQTLLPTHRHNKHILSLFQSNDHRYLKTDRKYNKSLQIKNPEKCLNQDADLRLSQEKIAPIFYNKITGRYELSTLLGRYESQLLDSSTNARLAKRSSRQLYNKKMINLLPQIPQRSKKKVESPRKDRTKDQLKQANHYRYHATISVQEDIWTTSHSEEAHPKTIDYLQHTTDQIDDIQLQNVQKAIQRKRCRIRPRVRINETNIQQKLQAAKSNLQSGQNIEDLKCQPWNYDNIQESDDIFK